eukprot:SAG22_NODE_12630_length_435_cov_0.889881_2_plen_103_part_01
MSLCAHFARLPSYADYHLKAHLTGLSTCRWIAAYSKFVRNVSATYDPPPEIFLTISHCTTGNASMKYCADTRAAYERMKAEGMKNVHFLDVTQNGTGAWWSLG